MDDREFDLIVYGATGFVGKRATAYLASRAAAAGLRLAIGGRDRAKLAALAASVGGIPVFVADANDAEAMDALVRRTRVVLAMAGPFALYADTLVDACVRARTHYADITGETPWIRTLIDRHHERALADGTRIVPACGFDSVPADLGALLVARSIQREFTTGCGRVKGFYRAAGGLNGGTLATLISVMSDPKAAAALRDPDLLAPPGARTGAERDPVVASYDGDAEGWIAPFVMGPINTRVVRRSAGLFDAYDASYGPDFSYQEYLSFRGPLGAALAGSVATGTALAQATAAFAPSRSLLEPFLPKPGTGPSDAAVERGWFRCDFVGRASDGRTMRVVLGDSGDPNNAATVKFAAEAALALALDADRLPGGLERGGVLTPATALGDVLVERLRAAGMRVDVRVSERDERS